MALTYVWLSGNVVDAAGDTFGAAPAIPMTIVENYPMQGNTVVSQAAGSSTETSVTRPVWTCDVPSQLIAVYERHSVQGSTTIQVVKAAGSTPLGSGSNVLSTALGLTNGSTDITISATLLNSTSLTQLTTGDMLGIRWTTPGNLSPVGQITFVLQRL